MSEVGQHVAEEETAHDSELMSCTTTTCVQTETPFPMNLKRLTGPHLMCIARRMDLLTKGTVGENRVMIDGKLVEM